MGREAREVCVKDRDFSRNAQGFTSGRRMKADGIDAGRRGGECPLGDSGIKSTPA